MYRSRGCRSPNISEQPFYLERLLACMPGEKGCFLLLAWIAPLTSYWIVDCPICGRTVTADNINLHLDLQCPGQVAPSSSFPNSVSIEDRSSDNIVIDQPNDLDLRASRPKLAAGRGSPKNAYGIIAPAKSVPISPDPSLPQGMHSVSKGVKRHHSVPESDTDIEKKPRLNPLIANQP